MCKSLKVFSKWKWSLFLFFPFVVVFLCVLCCVAFKFIALCKRIHAKLEAVFLEPCTLFYGACATQHIHIRMKTGNIVMHSGISGQARQKCWMFGFHQSRKRQNHAIWKPSSETVKLFGVCVCVCVILSTFHGESKTKVNLKN